MDKKYTKGKWFYCEKSKGIKANNVNGLLATAWSVYNSDEAEQRLEGESWLDMRERTEYIRIEKELEMQANAKLISCAPEMLEMLEYFTAFPDEDFENVNEKELFTMTVMAKKIKEAKELIKKAT